MIEVESESFPPARSRAAGGHVYVRPPEPIEFPAEEPWEEHVGEIKRHLENRTSLYLTLRDLLAATSSVGSDQFVYFDPTDARRCLSPDAFVKLGVPDQMFRVWKTWERGAPELGVEIISDADHRDLNFDDKLARYRAAGIREVVRFDADDPKRPIRIWDHVSGDLVERAADDPQLRFCNALGLWWVVAEDELYGRMLRLARDRDGADLVPTPSEAQVMAEMALRQTQEALVAAEHEKLVAEEAEAVARREKAEAEEKLRAVEGELERLKHALDQARRGR